MKTLILQEPEIAVERIAPAWAAQRKIAVSDAAQALRRSWGILASGISEAEANALHLALKTAGVRTAVLEDAACVPAPAPQTLLRMPSSLADVWLLAACEISEERVTVSKPSSAGPSAVQQIASAGIFMATGLPIRLGPKKEKAPKTERSTENRIFLDIFSATPAGRFRLNAGEFDYSCLGPKKGYSAFGNAKVLLKNLAEKFPGAWLNAGARRLLGGNAGNVLYQSLDDLEKEIRWLMTRRAFPA
jgi:hypothetical protein